LTTSAIDAATNEILDETSDSFGIRYFEFSADNGFSLNIEPTKLIGTKHHQDFRDLAMH